MNLKINAPSFEIHNKYEIKLFDKEGNLKQEAVAYNKANSLKWMASFYNSYLTDSSTYVAVGSYKPSEGEEAGHYFLDSPYLVANLSYYNDYYIENPTSQESTAKYVVGTAVFPATTSYTGTFQEVAWAFRSTGLNYYNQDQLYSHAWIVDSEGNPISITKTEYEEMQITLIVQFTPKIDTLALPQNFKLYPAQASSLNGSCIYTEQQRSGANIYYIGASSFYPSCRCEKLYFCSSYAPQSSSDYFQDDFVPFEKSDYYTFNTSSSGSVILDSSSRIASYDSFFPCYGKITNQFLTQSNANIGFIHSIHFKDLGCLELPCKGLFNGQDYYIVKDILFETADGEKTNFYTNFNETVIKENDFADIKVYINGSLINNSKYYFTQFDSRKSPLQNKAIQVGNSKDETWKHSISSYYMSQNHQQKKIRGVLLTNKNCQSQPGEYYDVNQGDQDYIYPFNNYQVVYFDEAGISLDHVRYGKFNRSSSTFTFVLSYRNSEEEDWIDINLSMTPFSYQMFDRVTAKYWKIGNFSLKPFCGTANTTVSAYNLDPNTLVFGDSLAHDFTKVGLNFYEPPAEGSVITMDANLNLPYKTSESVMSFSAEIVLDPAAAHTSTDDEEEEDEE